MTRTGGTCFLFGSLLVTLLTTLAPSSFSSTAVEYGNAIVAAVVGTLALLWGRRLRLWQFHALVATATLQITVSVYVAASPAIAASFATLYVFIACAAFFVTWPAAALQLALAVACCMAALTLTATVPWWSGLVAAGTTAAIGIVIAILGRIVSNAELDDITGLPNRRGFDRLLGVAIGRIQSTGQSFSVVLIHLDGYRAIHKEFGVQASDDVMQHVAASWRAVLEPEHVLARQGADELALMLQGVTEQEAVVLTERLRVAIAMNCSAGVTTWQPGESSAVTLARADRALRRAKRSGRERTMVEYADLPPLAAQLGEALAAGEVNVCYQPIVNTASGDVVGYEALMRWAPPSHPDLAPSEVVSVAEETNLIATLGESVLRRACLDAQNIQRHEPNQRLLLSVNVSGLELLQDGYAERVFAALIESGWAANQLVLEVTESVLDVDRPTATADLQDLRAAGVRIAIDDFGTGYSSLSRLQALPTDFLKLDASFIAMVTPSAPDAPPLLQAIAGLAEALHLPVVAEGVETAQQASVLQRVGIVMAQGFYFGRPQTLEELRGGRRASR